MATRKTRSDSATAAVSAMVNASLGDIEPPAHISLRDGDLVFWTGVVRARGRDEWTETDLVVAGQLARTLADIEREQLLLDAEGTIVLNERGTKVCNPRVSILEQFARREMALMRTLRIGGKVAGPLRDVQATRQVERTARRVRAEVQDELLA